MCIKKKVFAAICFTLNNPNIKGLFFLRTSVKFVAKLNITLSKESIKQLQIISG